jgi:RNA-binding protein YhbY
LVAGCYGYGTYSGAEAITDTEILREIAGRVKAEQIGVIVKSFIIYRIPQKPAIIEAFRIE